MNGYLKRYKKQVALEDVVLLINKLYPEDSFKVKLVPAMKEIVYIGMGGAYEDAITRSRPTSDAGMELDGYCIITPDSPIGGAILGRSEKDDVQVMTPGGKSIYTIFSVQKNNPVC